MNDHIDVLSSRPSRIVVVEGLIGAGKSSLIEIVRATLQETPGEYAQVIVYKEPIAPKMLSAYLADQKKYALVFQHNILFKQLNIYWAAKAIATAHPGTLILIDRGIDGNRAFAKMQYESNLFTETDYQLYLEETGATDGSVDELTSNELFKTIYLRCEPQTAFERMKKRGVEGEVKCYTLEYFESLHRMHEEFMKRPGVHTIDWDNEKCIDDPETRDAMVRQLLEVIK